MNTKSILKGISLASISLGSVSVINRILNRKYTSQNLLYNNESEYFNWRYGKIHYTKAGTGSPVLLIHELEADASSYEWNKIQYELGQKYTVYTMDLLGCGRSEKPDFSYTSYIFIQLISDFIRNIIGQKTDVITSGNSSSLAVTACSNHPELIRRIIMINPDSFHNGLKIPGKASKIRKKIIEMPIIGSLLYNIAFSKKEIALRLNRKYKEKRYTSEDVDVAVRAEASHLGGTSARCLYGCIIGNYLHIPFRTAVQKTDNSLFMIVGSQKSDAQVLIWEYQTENPAIEAELIHDSCLYPHMEQPEETVEMIEIYLS